ncbi:MAG: glycosyltransferase family 2 protein [Planctomycetota bacterium]|jgi:glycosyltransferase involved in cell wall biosynthesis
MKTTVAIPCAWHHVRYLGTALTRIAAGTQLPDEVVIVISPVEPHKDLQQIHKLWQKFRKHFHLKIEFYEFPLDIVSARHALTKYITGDVIIYHDADDTQHPQRVEIVKRFFNEYDIVHLCHSYKTFNEGQTDQIVYDDIKVTPSEHLYEKYFVTGPRPDAFGSPFMRTTAGCLCIRREVLQTVSWGNLIPGVGEDTEYCLKVLEVFNKTILIDVPLLNYNNSPERRMNLQKLKM